MSDPATRPEPSARRSLPTELGLIAAILVVLILATLLDSNHSYLSEWQRSSIDIIRPTVLLGIFALGSAVVIIAGGIDLSSGSMIAFSGTICASLMLMLNPEGMRNGHVGTLNIVIAIAGTLVAGFLVGSLHAWLITVVELPPFVATLATLVGLRSLGRAIVDNITAEFLNGHSTQIQIFDKEFRHLGKSVWIPAVIFLVLVALFWLLMSRTVAGRHLYAMGGNEAAARLSGIRTDRLKWLAYCLSSLTASIAGILYIGYESVADPQTLGRGYELNAIAAAVVGGCSLQGGVGTIPGIVLGCLFLRTVTDSIARIIKTNADMWEGQIVAIVMVVAVAFSQLRGAKGRVRIFPGALGWIAVFTLAMLAGTQVAMLTGKIPGALVGGISLVLLVGTKLWERRAAARLP